MSSIPEAARLAIAGINKTLAKAGQLQKKRRLFAIQSSMERGKDFSRRLEGMIAAEILGWTQVSADWRNLWFGTNPKSNLREVIPSFFSSVDAATLLVPEKWVESYYKRFDDTYVVECQPRGDLGLQRIRETSDHAAKAMTSASILAHAAMIDD